MPIDETKLFKKESKGMMNTRCMMLVTLGGWVGGAGD